MIDAKHSVWRSPKLWALAFGQLIAWTGLFYLFPALLIQWEIELGWDREILSLAFSASLISSALSTFFTGRIIDLGYSRTLMTVSVVIGGCCVSCLPFISTLWQFFTLWILIGIATAGCLYEPCFAYLTLTYGEYSQKCIVMVALIAGLASTLCFPLTTFIYSAIHWEAAAWIIGMATVLIGGPLFWLGTSNTNYMSEKSENKSISNGLLSVMAPLFTQPLFWLLSITFGAIALNHGIVISHILPILKDRGVQAEYAMIAASAIGISQIIGRLLLSGFYQKTTTSFLAILSLVALCLASMGLFLSGISVFFLALFVLFQGGSIGIQSIAKPVITAQIMGRENFGVINAAVSFLYVWGFALAPGLGGMIWSASGYDTLISITFSLALIATFALILALRKRQTN